MMVLLADCSRTFEATPRALSQPDQSPLPERAPALDRLGESSLSIREFALCDWLPMQDLPKSGHTRSREAPFGEKAGLLRRRLLAMSISSPARPFSARSEACEDK